MTEHRTCAICKTPLVQRSHEGATAFGIRKTCGYKCGRAAAEIKRRESGVHFGRPLNDSDVPWPRVTGEIDWQGAFAQYNIATNDGGIFRMMRPATLVHSVTTAADAAEMGAA